jgi:hypothetical protein
MSTPAAIKAKTEAARTKPSAKMPSEIKSANPKKNTADAKVIPR